MDFNIIAAEFFPYQGILKQGNVKVEKKTIAGFNVQYLPEKYDYYGLSHITSPYSHSMSLEDLDSSKNVRVEITSVTFSQVPLPGAVWLLFSVLMGLAGFRRKLSKR